MPGTWHRAVKLVLQVGFVRRFDALPSSSLSSVVLPCVVTRNVAARRRRFLRLFRGGEAFCPKYGAASSSTQRSLAPRGAVVFISRPRYGDEAAPGTPLRGIGDAPCLPTRGSTNES